MIAPDSVRTDLTSDIYLRITKSQTFYPVQFICNNGEVVLNLSENDARKAMRALMESFPLDALASIAGDNDGA